MTPPPKRPAKKTTPPASSPIVQNSQDLAELKAGVLALAERVNDLSTALTAVNNIQARVVETELRTSEVEQKTGQIEADLIPRSEHEERWKKEQQELIRTRLSIRRQTYIVGTAFFLLAMLALGVTTGLIFHDIRDRNSTKCMASNDYKKQDKQLWSEVIALSNQQQRSKAQQQQQRQQVKQFQAFLDKHDALAKC